MQLRSGLRSHFFRRARSLALEMNQRGRRSTHWLIDVAIERAHDPKDSRSHYPSQMTAALLLWFAQKKSYLITGQILLLVVFKQRNWNVQG